MRPAFHPEATIAGYCFGVEYSGSIEHLFRWISENGPAPKIEPRFARIEVLETIAIVHLEVQGWIGKAGRRSSARITEVFTLLKRDERVADHAENVSLAPSVRERRPTPIHQFRSQGVILYYRKATGHGRAVAKTPIRRSIEAGTHGSRTVKGLAAWATKIENPKGKSTSRSDSDHPGSWDRHRHSS